MGRLRAWGVRGSVPVSGDAFLRYGGHTTCFEIESNSGDIVILDAGTGLPLLGKTLIKRKIPQMTLLLTHLHLDHLFGFPFFSPLYRSETTLQIGGYWGWQKSPLALIQDLITPPFFPIGFEHFKATITELPLSSNPFKVGNIDISTIPISHPGCGLGYRFSENGHSIAVLTDNELGFVHPNGKLLDDYVAFVTGCNLLIHDAEYTPQDYVSKKGWGHSTFSQVTDLAIRAGIPKVGFVHHNHDRTDAQLDRLIQNQQRQVKGQVHCFGVRPGEWLR